MPRHPATGLERRAQHRIPGITRHIHRRNFRFYLGGGQDLTVDPVQPVRVRATINITHILQVVAEVHHAALAEHDIEVEFLTQPLPQLQGLFIQMCGLVPQIVRANDRRIAAGITAANPPFLEHGNPSDIMLGGKVISGREAVTAAADNNHVVGRRGLRAAPGLWPVLVVTDCVTCQTENGITIFSHTAPDALNSIMPSTTRTPPKCARKQNGF